MGKAKKHRVKRAASRRTHAMVTQLRKRIKEIEHAAKQPLPSTDLGLLLAGLLGTNIAYRDRALATYAYRKYSGVLKQPPMPTPDGQLPCTCGHAFTQHTEPDGFGCHVNECSCELYQPGTLVITS